VTDCAIETLRTGCAEILVAHIRFLFGMLDISCDSKFPDFVKMAPSQISEDFVRLSFLILCVCKELLDADFHF
jgi:hypothetical protein